MTSQEKFTFLDAKRKLLQPLVSHDEAHMLEMMFAKLAEIGVGAIPVESQAVALRELDKNLEKLIVEWIEESDEARIRSDLKARFGFSALGAQPAKQLKRILRERRISNDDEARLVKEFLDGSYLGWTADERQLRDFWEIFNAYERRAE